MSMWRSRWAAIGAAVAVTLGAGGLGSSYAAIDFGDRPVTVTIAPQRILDTRSNLGLQGRFLNESPRDLQVTGDVPIASGGTAIVVPADAVGVVVNVTVVNPDSRGFLSLRPTGATGNPTTSTVNFTAGSIEPNAATVDLGPGGRVQIFIKTAAANGTADVLVDVVGYTVDHTHDDRYPTHSELDALRARVETAESEVDALDTELAELRTVTRVFSPFGAQTDYMVIGDGTLGRANGCVFNNNTDFVYLPLDLPLGSIINEIEADVLSLGLDPAFEVRAVRSTTIDTGLKFDNLATATETTTALEVVEVDLTPEIVETVDELETFHIRLDDNGIPHGLCSVQVTYTRPAP